MKIWFALKSDGEVDEVFRSNPRKTARRRGVRSKNRSFPRKGIRKVAKSTICSATSPLFSRGPSSKENGSGGETPNCRLEILRIRSSRFPPTPQEGVLPTHPPSGLADNTSHEAGGGLPPTWCALYTYNRNFPNKSLSPRVTFAIGVEPFKSTSWLFISVIPHTRVPLPFHFLFFFFFSLVTRDISMINPPLSNDFFLKIEKIVAKCLNY